MNLSINKNVIAILFIAIIILLIVWRCRAKRKTMNDQNAQSKPNRITYNVKEFPAMHYLHDQLSENYQLFNSFCEEIINTKKISNIKRIEGIWIGKKADDFVKQMPDMWVHGWTNHDDWLNYLLAYNGQLSKNLNNQMVQHILNPIKEVINVAGLSLLYPYAKIKPHVDETTISNNRLTYHFNVFGDGSKITINGHTLEQQPKTSLIFDSGYVHSVSNGPEKRLLLYIDFSYNRAKSYIYGEIIKKVTDKQIIIEPYFKRGYGACQIYHPIYGMGKASSNLNGEVTIFFQKDIVHFPPKILVKVVNYNGF